MSMPCRTSTCAHCSRSPSPPGRPPSGSWPSASFCRGRPWLPALLTWRRGGDDEVATLAGSLSAHVVDALAGAPELLAFGAEARLLGAVEELGQRTDALERRHARLGTGTTLLVQVCVGVAVTAVLATGVAAVHAHHIGEVMVAVLPLAALATFETVPAVPLAVAQSLRVRASAQRLFALEGVPVPVRDPATPLPPVDGVPEVRFTDASLRYDPGLPRALDGVRLRLPAGGRVAVTGSSGAGKSSLVSALLRYWPLEDGTLSLGVADVADLRQADVRAACALADQRAQMFAGTVRSNLVLGRPDATEAEITDALRTARLEAWVATLPHGLDTPVGEEGVALSGGERRRLAVARALLAPGPVLVLDEPTSGLDPALADQLLRGVLAAAGDRSVLVITHRAAEAALCEVVVTLEAGRVVPAPA
jgi:ABC-type transport system involved in cytochrome bd biosynthesis fused ATPase/permease subunit